MVKLILIVKHEGDNRFIFNTDQRQKQSCKIIK